MINDDQGRGARKVLALLGTAALAVTGMVAGGAAANAVDEPSIANIVPPANGGSIIVHKHAGTPGAAGNGTEITGSAAEALGIGIDGVTFGLQRVTFDGDPIDLATADGWDKIFDGMTPADLTGDYGLVAAGTETTAGGGLATFSGLPMGLYLVTETVPPPGATETAVPFLVTVPYPNPTSSSWLYDVHVYPKNKLADNPTKTVTDPTWVLEGDEVTWTLNVPVPRPPAEATSYTKFEVTDALDSRLDYVSGSLTVTLNGTAVMPPDITVTEPSTANSNTLTVAFDVSKIRTGQTYVIEFDTEVNGAGVIPNTAVRNVNDTTTDIGPEQVNFAKVKVIKKRANSELTLQGAEFELWKGDKSAKLYGPTATNESGEIVFDAVGVGKGADKTEPVCLKETAPPPGYSIQGDGWTCLTLDAEATNATVEQTIDNTPRTTPNLPLTGSTGSVIFWAAGLALIVAAGGAALMASRRRTTTHE